MKLYYNMGPEAQPKIEIRTVKRQELVSVAAMCHAFEQEAVRRFGVFGRDWDFRQNPPGYLIPIYVVSTDRTGKKTGETITIE